MALSHNCSCRLIEFLLFLDCFPLLVLLARLRLDVERLRLLACLFAFLAFWPVTDDESPSDFLLLDLLEMLLWLLVSLMMPAGRPPGPSSGDAWLPCALASARLPPRLPL